MAKPPFSPNKSGNSQQRGDRRNGKGGGQEQGKPAHKGGNKQQGNRPSGPRAQQGGRAKAAPIVTVRSASDRYWVYSWHAALAALNNPDRQILRILVTDAAREKLDQEAPESLKVQTPRIDSATSDMLANLLGADAVHQGIAVEVRPLAEVGIEILSDSTRKGPVLLLDQVTDPHNVGAILRSAAAFDCPAVMVPAHHSAPETGIIARSAAGALEMVPLIRVPNLTRAMLALKSQGYWIAGLDASAEKHVHEADMGKKVALVLGAEGKGLRRLTAEHCDLMLKLPMHPRMESLNVSNAAAIALYELFKPHSSS